MEDAEVPGGRGSLRQAVTALRVPAYRWWFVSQILSSSGVMTQMVAQSWLILQLTNRPVDLGLLGMFAWTPALVVGPWAGAWVDRLDRRRLLVVTQTLFVVLGVVQSALAATGVIRAWMIFAVAASTGLVAALDGPARQVYVLELVGTARVASAVSLYEVIINASRVVGPAMGGVLLAGLGPPACFLANAASYLPVLLVLIKYPPTTRSQPAEATTAKSVAKVGLSYVWRTPAIRACVLIAAAGGTLFNMGVALPLLATEVFHLAGGGYGAMVAAFGVGALPGALLAAAGPAWPGGRRIRLLALLTGVAVVLTALSPHVVAAFIGLAATGFLSIWLIASANTLVQLRADPALRGRVMAVWLMALPGTMPFTGVLTGLVAQAVGARAGFAVAGAAMLVTVFLTWRALGR